MLFKNYISTWQTFVTVTPRVANGTNAFITVGRGIARAVIALVNQTRVGC